MTQEEAFEILKTGQNCFITGSAGAGKTYLVNAYIEYLRERNVEVAITASTGIAATHIGGTTIHSWSGIGINEYLTAQKLDDLAHREYLVKRFNKTKVLIIDEISMLKKGQLDMVNSVLQASLRNTKAFGGLQVILVGDFFQLPPVRKNGQSLRGEEDDGGIQEIVFEEYIIQDGEMVDSKSDFVFASSAWRAGGFTILYLTSQFRQQDDEFLGILNAIRAGKVQEKHKIPLRTRWKKPVESDNEPTRLFTHNLDVDRINAERLAELQGERAEYEMEDVKGNERLLESLRRNCLAPETLQLKVGAKVMCVKNNFEAGFVNGTIGFVEECQSCKNPVIRTLKGERIEIEKAEWAWEEDGKIRAQISQYPLRLAWAITVHKSQGMSLDAAEIDLSKSFERGMGYVALSRVRTLGGLSLIGMNEAAFLVDDEVLEFDKKLQTESELTAKVLHETPKKTLQKMQETFLKMVSDTKKKEKKLSTYDKTALDLSNKKPLKQIAKERNFMEETVVAHIETLIESGKAPDIGYLLVEMSVSKLQRISAAIKQVAQESDIGKVFLSPVKRIVGNKASFLEIRLVLAVMRREGEV